MLILIGLFIVSLWAGMQNAVAGGGTFITLPMLMLTGMDARAANITSTIALFPAQLATGVTGRQHVSGVAGLSVMQLVAISLLGGIAGAILLLVTPPASLRGWCHGWFCSPRWYLPGVASSGRIVPSPV
jgi:uncharacterized membrane protein YfcA